MSPEYRRAPGVDPLYRRRRPVTCPARRCRLRLTRFPASVDAARAPHTQCTLAARPGESVPPGAVASPWMRWGRRRAAPRHV